MHGQAFGHVLFALSLFKHVVSQHFQVEDLEVDRGLGMRKYIADHGQRTVRRIYLHTVGFVAGVSHHLFADGRRD